MYDELLTVYLMSRWWVTIDTDTIDKIVTVDDRKTFAMWFYPLFNKVIQFCKSMWFCILKKKKKIMKYFISEIFVLINTFLLINSTSDTEFEEDFIHSFLIKSEKLKKSERLKSAGDGWLEKTAYKVKVYMKYFSKVSDSFLIFNNLHKQC